MIARSLATLALVAAPLAAQQTSGTQSTAVQDFKWEKALAAGSHVSLHNISGNVDVSLSTSGKVEITGVRGRRRYAEDLTIEVIEHSRGITVCAMNKNRDQTCDEDGLRSRDDRRRRYRDDDWDSGDLDIVVKLPKTMRVSAGSVSGDVRIAGAEGIVRGSSVSGDVEMRALRATAVRASSVSGDIDVTVDALTGDGDLSFTSVSGNVSALLPANLDADVSMRSVSGELDSEFPLTLNGRMNRRSLEARIGKGGRMLEVNTVSGDVRLRSIK